MSRLLFSFFSLRSKLGIGLVLGLSVGLGGFSPVESQAPEPSRHTFGRLPLYFIQNRGVWPKEVAYVVQGADRTLLFRSTGVTTRFHRGRRGGLPEGTVQLDFVSARRTVWPEGEGLEPARFSFFRGKPSDWKTGLRTYARVVYRDLWPGIDLVYSGTTRHLKYAFVVHPGADPTRIRLRYRGVDSLAVNRAGTLEVRSPAATFEDAAPVAHQEFPDRRESVEVGYVLAKENTHRGGSSEERSFHYGFQVGEYDSARPLLIDPAVLVFCGYLGGVKADAIAGLALDATGNMYVTGATASDQTTFPVRVGPDLTFNGGSSNGADEVFVAKLDPTGTTLLYCGYIGGAGYECGMGIAVDSQGRASVTGWTTSPETSFPVKVGPDLTFNGGMEGFVARVNAAGTGLDYCGYIGGADYDSPSDIALDAVGNAYVVGLTHSSEATFPVVVGPDLTYNGSTRKERDGFVAKVDVSGQQLLYCGYIGGSNVDEAESVAVDAAGHAYVLGRAMSDHRSFPVVVGPDLTFNGGASDAFVARVNPAGTGLDYCGYIGGASPDGSQGNQSIAVDALGRAHVFGQTYSDASSFPVSGGPSLTLAGLCDVFVARVNPAGTALEFCGYLGGTGWDVAYGGLALDTAGHMYVAGSTSSTEAVFPVRVGPDLTFNGNPMYDYDAFIARINGTSFTIDYCGYIGGQSVDDATAVVADAAGNAYVAGSTYSDEQSFPVVTGPDLTYNGGQDAFVAMVAFSHLVHVGVARPGLSVRLDLKASDSRGLPYQFGSSFGTGPIPVGARTIGLSADPLLVISVGGLLPGVFRDYAGQVDSQGEAHAAIQIPNHQGLVGLTLHSAAVTLDPRMPSGIRTITNTTSFLITP